MGERPRQERSRPGSSPERPPAGNEVGDGEPASRRPREIGGPKGPEPTRYGDWEKGGRCTDF